jgi:hypothetical protein
VYINKVVIKITSKAILIHDYGQRLLKIDIKYNFHPWMRVESPIMKVKLKISIIY